MESPKILIIEDELPLLNVLRDKFTLEGLQVIATQSAEQALELAVNEKPSVILTDLIMYPVDGIAFIKKLRLSGPWGAKVPCIIFSNEQQLDLKTDLKGLNIAKYINKADTPIDALVSDVKAFLS
jgi:DNA-binding response OmpR family regulator